jgi:hypothetical protein
VLLPETQCSTAGDAAAAAAGSCASGVAAALVPFTVAAVPFLNFSGGCSRGVFLAYMHAIVGGILQHQLSAGYAKVLGRGLLHHCHHRQQHQKQQQHWVCRRLPSATAACSQDVTCSLSGCFTWVGLLVGRVVAVPVAGHGVLQ